MKRHLKFVLRLLIPALFLLATIFTAFKVVSGPTFQISQVNIYGNSDIFSELSLFKKPQNLLFLSLAQLKDQIITTFPYVKNVTIQKKFPNKVLIQVEERVPVAEYIDEEYQLYIDEEGVFLPRLERFANLSFPKLICQIQIGKEERISDQNLVQALKILAGLRNEVTSIQNLACKDSQTYMLTTDKTEVIFPTSEDHSQVISSLQFLFKQFRIEGKQPEVVDLRFEKPVLIPKKIQEASSSTESSLTN